MSVKEGVIQYLLTVSGVTALVGQKIYPNYSPQTTELYLVVEQNGGEPGYHSKGEDGLHEAQIVITAYGPLMGDVEAVIEQVRLALSGKPAGDMGGIEARFTTVDDVRDRYTPPGVEADEVGYPGKELLATVWHLLPVATFS